jgi:hypothetical protein
VCEEYDFKGNVLQKTRRVIRDDEILKVFPNREDPNADWNIRAFRVNWDPLDQQEAALLDVRVFATSASYDALNRVKTLRYPKDVKEQRNKVLRPRYNRAGALEGVTLDDGGTLSLLVERVAYDAKGQRTLVALGNGVITRYAYEPRTYRLARLRSERFDKPPGDTPTYEPFGQPLQDFAYE